MPYISTTDDNRYLGEHCCHHYHYGDMTMIRPCCVTDARHRKAQAQEVALTSSHPVVTIWTHAWNCLTDAEQVEVGNWMPDDTWR